MFIKILGKRWRLQESPQIKDRGICESPKARRKRILIRPDLEGEERLEVLLHEMLHAAFWHLDEGYVEEASKDMARALWRLGYRDSRQRIR